MFALNLLPSTSLTESLPKQIKSLYQLFGLHVQDLDWHLNHTYHAYLQYKGDEKQGDLR